MSARDAKDAEALIERMGAALDRLSAAGFPETHGLLARGVRQMRGQVRRPGTPSYRLVREMLDAADELERLAACVEAARRAEDDRARNVGPYVVDADASEFAGELPA